MQDRNNLELSKVQKGLNAYRFSYVHKVRKSFMASAYASFVAHSKTSTFDIMHYDDSRDAAYVGQTFMQEYDPETVRALYESGDLGPTVREFLSTVEIPVWEFPAEGYTKADLTEGMNYEKNRVEGAIDSLREVFKALEMKAPPLKEIPALIATCEALYAEGFSWRAAALETVK